MQFQREMRSSIKSFENQVSQFVTVVNHLEFKVEGKLLSQLEVNRKNMSAMRFRSGKEIERHKSVVPKEKSKDQIEKEIEKEGKSKVELKVISEPKVQVKSNPSSFPSRLEKWKKQDKEKNIFEIFCKMDINIPLLDLIKQVLKYTKFLKGLCINKKKLKGDESNMVGENVVVVLQRKLSFNCGDLGMFIILCKIKNSRIRNAMLDLGVSINMMPKSICDSLDLGPLKETKIITQVADRTNAYPDVETKDALV